jgi:hypothetical protein
MRTWWLIAACTVTLGPAQVRADGSATALSDPVQILAGGKPISVSVGHAAPYVADIDGDGNPELLVGQFEDGKLRIYQNQGTRAEPRFEQFTWFQAGGTTGKVPSG